MNIAMMPEDVLAAAKQTDANTAQALKAAQDAVNSLVALKGSTIFGVSPAGTSTDQVFGKASTVIDELITEVNKAIVLLTANLHASVDAVLKGQEVARVDYAKLTQDNTATTSAIGSTGIQPGDTTYVAPQRTAPSTSDGSGAAGGETGRGSGSGSGSGGTG